MADNTKKLHIKLLVDTKEGAKLAATISGVAKETEKLSKSFAGAAGKDDLSSRITKLKSFRDEILKANVQSARVIEKSLERVYQTEFKAAQAVEKNDKIRGLMDANRIRSRQRHLDLLNEEKRRAEVLIGVYQKMYRETQKSLSGATLGGIAGNTAAAVDDRRSPVSRNTSSLSSALGMRQQEKNETERLLKAEQDLLVVKQRALTLGVSASAVSANAIAQQRTAAVEIKRDIGTALGMRQQETIAIRNATNALNQQAAAQQQLLNKKRATLFNLGGGTTTNAARVESRPAAVTANRSMAAMGLSNAKRQDTKEIQNNTKALRDNNSAAGILDRTKSSLTSRVIEAVTVYKLYNATLHSVRNAMRAIPQIGIEMQSTFASLSSTIGTEAGAVFFMEKLNQEAKRTGIEITTLRETFRTFQASTSLAGESLESTWNMFQNINTVATALHQTADKTNLTFLALAQIFNKSKVQAEELVKQLGNLLPGAFASFQKANEDMFKTIPDLVKAMRDGTVMAQDTVEKFTNFMADRFAGAFVIAAQGLNAEFGRMTTSITLLGESIFKSIEQPLTQSVRSMTQFIDYLNEATTSGNALTGIIRELGFVIDGLLTLAFVGVISKLGKFAAAFTSTRYMISGAEVAIVSFASRLKLLASRAVLPAVIIALGTFISKLTETDRQIQKTRDSVSDFIDEIKKKRAELLNQSKQQEALSMGNLVGFVDRDPTVKGFTDKIAEAERAYKDAKERFDKLSFGLNDSNRTFLQPILDKEADALIKQVENIIFLKDRLKDARADALEEAKKQSEGMQFQLPTIEGQDTLIEYLKNQGNLLEAAKLEAEKKYGALANALILERTKVRAAMFSGAIDIKDMDKADSLIAAINSQLAMIEANKQSFIDKATTPKAPKQKDNNAIYDSIKREYDLMAISAESAFNKLEDLYDDNLISIDAYFKEKERLRIDDLNNETEALRRIQAEASRMGDVNKVASVEFDIQKKHRQEAIEQERRDRARIVALREFSDLQKQTQADYLEFQGNAVAAEALRAEIDFRDRINKAIIEGDKNLQDQLKTLKSHRINLIELDELSRRRNINTERLNQLEIRYQRDVELGIMSQGDAVTNINNLRSEGLDLLQDEIDRTRQILEANQESLTLQEKLNALLAERDNLGNTPNINRVLDPTQGPTGFFGEFQQNKSGIDQDYKQAKGVSDLKIKEAVLSQNWDQYEVLLQGRLALDEKYSSATAHVYTGLYGGMFKLGADTFQGITDAAAAMYGAQSKEARKAFMITKGIRMAEAAMATAQAVIVALGAGPYIGIALAAITAALGAAQIAQIAAQQPPAAHGGLTNVPKEQTYLLDKGERVLSPNQNKDLTNFIESAKDRKNTVENKGGNTYNINVAVKTDKNDSPDEIGEKIAVAAMRQIAKQEIQNARRVGNSLNPINRV